MVFFFLPGSWALVQCEAVTFDPPNKHNWPLLFMLVVQRALCHAKAVLRLKCGFQPGGRRPCGTGGRDIIPERSISCITSREFVLPVSTWFLLPHYYYYYYSLSPLCRVFTILYLKHIMSLRYVLLQLFCSYNLCYM